MQQWAATLARRGSEPAIFDGQGVVLRRFDEIEGEVCAFEPLLDGYAPGSVVALQLGNDPRWPALLLAIWRRGLVVLPLGTHVEGAEFRLISVTCGVAGLIACHGKQVQITRVEQIAPASPWEGDEPDLLKLTSGTTGAPRAIRFRAAQLLADCENICATMGITEADVNFGVIPFAHSYGFSNLITPLLCKGVALVATDERLPRAVLRGLQQSGATVFPGMPVFYEKLAALGNESGALPLRLCLSAGAPLLSSVASAFTRVHGLKIHSFYGSSECGGICYDRSDEPNYDDGWVGTPMEGVQLEPAPDHGPQRFAVRSAAVADSYYPKPEPATLHAGRFVPGDLVEWREGGLALVGRSSDVINIAGRKLNPGEIEGRIASFPGVQQVVVFGIPSALRGEEPVACVAGGSVDSVALQRHCARELSAWQMPRAFWVVEEIPTNERGKTSRRDLAQRYLSR